LTTANESVFPHHAEAHAENAVYGNINNKVKNVIAPDDKRKKE
jgi:hypothetical protein